MAISALKKKLDTIFSLYIRLRDSNEFGIVRCFTCWVEKNYKEGMQNGHFMSRQYLSTRFDEQNCQPQCVACNMYHSGEQFKFGLGLEYKYGNGTAKKLLQKSRQPFKMSKHEYEEKISYYKSLVENLLKEKGLSLKK
jgi:hypothetical protein